MKYTNDDLINEVKKLHQELGRVPNGSDFKKRKPNLSTFLLRFGTWENTLFQACLIKEKQKVNDYTKEELIKYLKKYYDEFGKVPTARDLKNNKEYPTCETYRKHFGSHKNALIEAGLFDLRKDKFLFDRLEYSKEDLIDSLNKFIKKYNRIPISKDFKTNNELPSENVIYKFFKNLNELIIFLGYEPIYDSLNIRSNEKLLSELYQLYLEIGKTPTSVDIDKCHYTASFNAYVNRFGSIYNSLELANIPYQKRTTFLSDEDVVELWYKLKNNLDRIPTINDMYESDINIIFSITERWGSYTEFLKAIGEKSNYNRYGCKVYITNKGTKCFSFYEYKITKWLEENNIQFKKDFPYAKVIRDDSSKRTFDWVISYGDKKYFVELFGIQNVESYDMKRDKKIKDCKNNNIDLIELYPNILRNKPLDEVFYFLV